MNFKSTTLALLIAAVGTTAHADGAKTRDEVKAELAYAIRTGDIMHHGEISGKLNELFPSRYPAKAAIAGKSRSDVDTELVQAQKNGDLIANGESGLRHNQMNPSGYPAAPVLAGKSRDQVKAELAEAVHTGDMPANGEAGVKLNEQNPRKYANQRGTQSSNTAFSANSAVRENLTQ
jgi:Domain of unknown function (DUF4148)